MAATPSRSGGISIPCSEPRISAGNDTWMMNPLMVAGASSGNLPARCNTMPITRQAKSKTILAMMRGLP